MENDEFLEIIKRLQVSGLEENEALMLLSKFIEEVMLNHIFDLNLEN